MCRGPTLQSYGPGATRRPLAMRSVDRFPSSEAMDGALAIGQPRTGPTRAATRRDANVRPGKRARAGILCPARTGRGPCAPYRPTACHVLCRSIGVRSRRALRGRLRCGARPAAIDLRRWIGAGCAWRHPCMVGCHFVPGRKRTYTVYVRTYVRVQWLRAYVYVRTYDGHSTTGVARQVRGCPAAAVVSSDRRFRVAPVSKKKRGLRARALGSSGAAAADGAWGGRASAGAADWYLYGGWCVLPLAFLIVHP